MYELPKNIDDIEILNQEEKYTQKRKMDIEEAEKEEEEFKERINWYLDNEV